MRWRRRAHLSLGSELVRSWPSKRTLPSVGSISRMSRRPVVVLPLPLSPARPKTSPRSIAQVDAIDGSDELLLARHQVLDEALLHREPLFQAGGLDQVSPFVSRLSAHPCRHLCLTSANLHTASTRSNDPDAQAGRAGPPLDSGPSPAGSAGGSDSPVAGGSGPAARPSMV